MLRILAGIVTTLLCMSNIGAAPSVEIRGTGSAFVQPILTSWANTWKQKSGVKMNYDDIGSVAGIAKVKGHEADFVATDAPISDEELKTQDLLQFPVVTSGIVAVVNLGERQKKSLRLTGAVLADIYLGTIKQWDDSRLKDLNPTLNLPAQPIIVVHRKDSSEITLTFSHYLSKVSPSWAQTIGSDKIVKWPVGHGVDGNNGVADAVLAQPYTIGYVEYGYAVLNEMRIVMLQNKAGNFVSPNDQTMRVAAEIADWQHALNFNLSLVDTSGDQAWPIATVTWVAVPRHPKNASNGKAVLAFFQWALTNGGQLANFQGFTPLPNNLVQMIELAWNTDLVASKG